MYMCKQFVVSLWSSELLVPYYLEESPSDLSLSLSFSPFLFCLSFFHQQKEGRKETPAGVWWIFSPSFSAKSSELLITSQQRVPDQFDQAKPKVGWKSSSHGRRYWDGEKNNKVEGEEKRIVRGFSSTSTWLVAADRIRTERLSSEMSNLTAASNAEASVSSSGNRTAETTAGGGGVGSSSMYPLEHRHSTFHPPPTQSSQPPLKKKRSLPGNPGSGSSISSLSWCGYLCLDCPKILSCR